MRRKKRRRRSRERGTRKKTVRIYLSNISLRYSRELSPSRNLSLAGERGQMSKKKKNRWRSMRRSRKIRSRTRSH